LHDLPHLISAACEISVGNELPVWNTGVACRGENARGCFGKEEGLPTEDHYGSDGKAGGDLTDQLGGKARRQMLPAFRVIPLGAVTASTGAGACQDEFDFVQTFQIRIHIQ